MTDVIVDDRQVTVDTAEIERRTIRRTDWVPCNSAFIDCRTPGSDRKENYAFIGAGVSQNANQYVNLEENHGFNTGAAGMPNGISNNLHLHFTAEVFINLGGEFRLRWGVDGKQGEYISHDGDIVTIPTWIFRGFTNEGPDEGILYTVLGRDDNGGIIWGPSVLREAESYGLHLTADNQLIDTVAGDVLPDDVALITPMKQHYIDELTEYTVEDMRSRVIQPGDRKYSKAALLCAAVDGGRVELATAIGYGMSENRRQVPNVHEPHSFNLAWVKAEAGQGVLRHRHDKTQALLFKTGRWEVTLNDDSTTTVNLGAGDAFSVPEGAWRSYRCVEGDETGSGTVLVINGGDDRVYLEWAPEVVEAAAAADWTIDPNGYLAPLGVMVTATEDD
ncbi:cupin domain-containing protein [Microbacterium sp. W4I20]|uniref:cupin domain-containing protein n=1 Tax=Microbacterium sp. W4I20 TaxID=3042262 RepID=UPI0027862DE9|nr:cupin domain-containing protein [Microbacterium sp. W4I20]MDQ0727187.1 quercetin dioxygenase-like cupin family protein [Microbacterium sp. W4I20]